MKRSYACLLKNVKNIQMFLFGIFVIERYFFCFEFGLLQTCASDKNVFLLFWRAVFLVVSGFWQMMMKWFVTGRSEPKKAIMRPSVLMSFNYQSSLVPSMVTAWAFMMVRTELLFWLLNAFQSVSLLLLVLASLSFKKVGLTFLCIWF